MNSIQKYLALYGFGGLSSFFAGYLIGKRRLENYLREEENRIFWESKGSRHPLSKKSKY